jgi:hypothetical protein
MDVLSVNNKLLLGYEDTDFLWVDVFSRENVDCATQKLQCSRDNSTSTFLTPVNSRDCFLSEVCTNKEHAATLKAMSNAHSGASGRVSDSKGRIQKDILSCINYSLALLLLFYCLQNIIV